MYIDSTSLRLNGCKKYQCMFINWYESWSIDSSQPNYKAM